METNKWNILVIDDDEEICNQLKEGLSKEKINGDTLEVIVKNSFDDAIDTLGRYRIDVVILDIISEDKDNEAGIKVLNMIKERWFVPVIFYSGLAHTVKVYESNVVKMVNKEAGLGAILENLKMLFDSGIPQVNKSIIEHVETVQRDYMWNFMASYWGEFGQIPDRVELAYLLARRLSLSFTNYGVKQITDKIPIEYEVSPGEMSYGRYADYQVTPMHFYIIPPLEDKPLTGDLYQGQLGDRNGYWLVLTPSCDFFQGKAERILLAECNDLVGEEDYKDWAKNPDNKDKKSRFKQFLGNGKNDRTFFLPNFLDHPNLVADFQKLVSCKNEEFEKLKRIASLDSIFSSEVISKFIRYYARVGTPDLHKDEIIRSLTNQINQLKTESACGT